MHSVIVKALVVGGGTVVDESSLDLRSAEAGRRAVYEAKGYKLLGRHVRPGHPYERQAWFSAEIPRPVTLEIEFLVETRGHSIEAGKFGGWWLRERDHHGLGQRRFKTDDDLRKMADTERSILRHREAMTNYRTALSPKENGGG